MGDCKVIVRQEQNRAEHIDILRIIACFMVIFNHTDERGFWRYAYNDRGTALWIVNLIPSIACKPAVPIFFMISGALLLRKNESIKKTYGRIRKILFDLVLFSILYFAVDSYLNGNKFDLKEIVSTMIQSNYWHLWYLYSYIIFIVTLPFFRDFAQNLRFRNFKILYVLAIVTMGIFPIIEYFFGGINPCLKPSWITINIFIYPLVGYMIENKINSDSVKSRHIFQAWLINVICFAVSIISEYFYLEREPGSVAEIFICLFCIINASTVYLTVKWIVGHQKMKSGISRMISKVGKCTFGIYLLHILLLWRIQPFYRFCIKYFETGKVGNEFGIYLSCICVFAIAGVVTCIFQKIPLIKRLF